MLNILILSAALQAAEPVADAAPAPTPAPTVVAGKEVDCDAHKFETKVQVTDERGSRPVTLKLCPFKGSTKASWLRTLRDARMKIAVSGDIGAEDKARIDRELGDAIRGVDQVKKDGEVEPKS